VTTAELSRGVARIEHSLEALTAQVATLSGVMRETRAEITLRETHQAERTAGRDRQMADVHARLDAQQTAIADLQQARWSMTGRMAGVLAALTILGSGAATAVARLTG
jgi:chromosome segregation ATPase